MRSNDPFEGLDFDRDLPVTPEDVRALREAKLRSSGLRSSLPSWRIVELLVAALPPAARRPKQRTFEGHTPFEL